MVPDEPLTLAEQAARQATVDKALEEFLTPFLGRPLSLSDVRRVERDARSLLLDFRRRNMISFRDVRVKLSENGLEVIYDR